MEDQNKIAIRKIAKADNEAIALIIRECLQEFGAVGSGFAWGDPEVDVMFETYQDPKSIYYIVEIDGVVSGGGGIAPSAGGTATTCELQKMYFTRTARGKGIGGRLLDKLLADAKSLGFDEIYLETLKHMDAANALYRKLGFEPLEKPMGDTGHCGCDFWYRRSLVV